MIPLPQGFRIGSVDPIDTRLVLTQQEMRNINDLTMPDVYFAICKDDNQVYIYNKVNDKDIETGRFRLYAAATGEVAPDGTTVKVESIEWKRLG